MTIDDAWSVCELIGSRCNIPTEFIFIRLVYLENENEFSIRFPIPTGSVSFYSDLLHNPKSFEYLISILNLSYIDRNSINDDLVSYAISKISNGLITEKFDLCMAEDYHIQGISDKLGIKEKSFVIELLPFTTVPYIEKITNNLNVVINNSRHDGINIVTVTTDIKSGAELLSRMKLAHCEYLLYVFI